MKWFKWIALILVALFVSGFDDGSPAGGVSLQETARVDTISGTQFFYNNSIGYAGTKTQQISATRLGAFVYLNAQGHYIGSAFEIPHADSIYIDSIEVRNYFGSVAAADTDTVWVGLARFAPIADGDYWHYWAQRDTIVGLGGAPGYNSVVFDVGAGWIGINPFILGAWYKHREGSGVFQAIWWIIYYRAFQYR